MKPWWCKAEWYMISLYSFVFKEFIQINQQTHMCLWTDFVGMLAER